MRADKIKEEYCYCEYYPFDIYGMVADVARNL